MRATIAPMLHCYASSSSLYEQNQAISNPNSMSTFTPDLHMKDRGVDHLHLHFPRYLCGASSTRNAIRRVAPHCDRSVT